MPWRVRTFKLCVSLRLELTVCLVQEKLKQTSKEIGFKPEIEEEYEDSEGNVFNKKTYEDLRRQGLL